MQNDVLRAFLWRYALVVAVIGGMLALTIPMDTGRLARPVLTAAHPQ